MACSDKPGWKAGFIVEWEMGGKGGTWFCSLVSFSGMCLLGLRRDKLKLQKLSKWKMRVLSVSERKALMSEYRKMNPGSSELGEVLEMNQIPLVAERLLGAFLPMTFWMRDDSCLGDSGRGNVSRGKMTVCWIESGPPVCLKETCLHYISWHAVKFAFTEDGRKGHWWCQ